MSKDNILKEGNYECTGCGICVKKCPTNAISIQKDEDGHLKAVVEKDKCVECGQCITVCQKFRKEDPSRKIDLARAYYGYSNDEKVLKMSTSGGVVYEICKEFLKKKYKIIGVTYDCQKTLQSIS